MPTEESLPDSYSGLKHRLQERLGVEPAMLKRLNNRHLTRERVRELMAESLRMGKPHPDLKVQSAGLLEDPRIQVD